MNSYQQYWFDMFEKVNTKSELERAFEMACSGHVDDRGIKVATGCNRQGTCIPHKCPIYREYKRWLAIIDDVRRPRVIYIDTPDPQKYTPIIKKERGYEIKPQMKCRRDCKCQITKMLKKEDADTALLNQILDHVEGFRFKRAYNLCVKHSVYNIAETLGKFIENN